MSRGSYLLLVEDNPADVELVRRAARECHPPLRIEVVNDGESALEFLLGDERPARRPAAILLDLTLPGVSGFDVLDAVRGEHSLVGLPVVVFSGSDEPGDVGESYRRGASSFVRKPNGHRELVAQLEMLGRYWLSFNLPGAGTRVLP